MRSDTRTTYVKGLIILIRKTYSVRSTNKFQMKGLLYVSCLATDIFILNLKGHHRLKLINQFQSLAFIKVSFDGSN